MEKLDYSILLAYPLDENRYINILTIAGSDPSGGAGLQADLKTFTSLKAYGMTVITAFTAQNTCGVDAICYPPLNFIRQQLHSIFRDIRIDCIKIGMLGKREIIDEIFEFFEEYGHELLPPIVVDPVIYAKNGQQIIDDNAIATLKQKLIPMATVLTPNLKEASRLLDETNIDENHLIDAAVALTNLGPKAVILKGKNGKDCLFIRERDEPIWIGDSTSWISTNNVHGTGCTFSAAIAVFLGRGNPLLIAIHKAKTYITEAIRAGSLIKQGNGVGPVCHHWLSVHQSFIQRAWLSVSLLYEKIKALPFVNELGKGILPWHKFEKYIQQDFLFLLDRMDVCELLLERFKNISPEVDGMLNGIRNNSRSGANDIFKKYNVTAITRESDFKSSVCTAYTDYLKTLAISKDHILFGLIGLAPCSLIYQKIGEYIKDNQKITPCLIVNPSYQSWIDTYSSENRRNSVERFMYLIDSCYVHMNSTNNDDELLDVFMNSTHFEFNFWEEAYQSDCFQN